MCLTLLESLLIDAFWQVPVKYSGAHLSSGADPEKDLLVMMMNYFELYFLWLT